MNKNWICFIFSVSMILMTLQKCHQSSSLNAYYTSSRPLKISAFEKCKSKLNKNEIDYLVLWESILTGRSAPVKKWMKDRYQLLGLNHIFTPSGFHLSAVLSPIMKFFPKLTTYTYCIVFILLFFLPGLLALKRMALIKFTQQVVGTKSGFILALILDVLWGSFQTNMLSFTYSFLFLGIIYSQSTKQEQFLLFFCAQMMIVFFNENNISLLVLFISPILNFIFALMMPLLALLSFPLWDWQLFLGIKSLQFVQKIVDLSAKMISLFPMFEVTLVLGLGLIYMMRLKKREMVICFMLYQSSLNQEFQKYSFFNSKYQFVPLGVPQSKADNGKNILTVFQDGRCRMKLIKGIWWESCSPKKKRSSPYKFKKLSSL